MKRALRVPLSPVFAVLLSSCAHPATLDAPSVLLPASLRIRAAPLDAPSADVAVLTRRSATDTLPRPVSRLTLSVAPTGDAGVARLTRRYAPPFHSDDTLFVDRSSLAPRSEVLAFNGALRRFTYAGPRVTGTIALPDSAPKAFDQTFDTPVFAFNEVDVLARSLPFEAGLRIVVPLFSEVDAAIEHDTLAVGGHTTFAGADAWTVTFADPVITTRYVIDARSRRLLDAVTTQRKSGVQFLYRYK